MATVTRAVLAGRDRLVAMRTLDQDALLYLGSAVLAAGTAVLAVSTDYRQWAEMALGPYAIAAVASFGVARRRARRSVEERPSGRDKFRGLVVLAVLLTAVLVPLTVEVVLRAEAKPGAHAQVEVAVIEQCGLRVAHHQNCYLNHPQTVGISPSSDAPGIDSNSFFPYLPGMIPFGLISATSGPPELKDARIALSGFTIVVVGLALAVAGVESRRKWRLFQLLVVLPSGALPMVTGGDDLPVIALMLLGLVLSERRRPIWSGIAMGLAGTLKFTAWPLLVLLGLVVRDSKGRHALLRYSIAVLAVVVPVLGIGIGLDPHAFVENAIRFPLGLTKVKSPAASPLLGQELVSLLPTYKSEVIVVLAAVGIGAVVYGLRRWTPQTPEDAARFTGLAMLLATVIAPATRFGYLIYPLNLLAWSVLLSSGAFGVARSPESTPGPGRSGQDPSGIWKRRSRTLDELEVSDPPASAGAIVGVTGVTTTPISQS